MVPCLIVYQKAKDKTSSKASSERERDSTKSCQDLSLTQSRTIDISLAPGMLAKSQIILPSS